MAETKKKAATKPVTKAPETHGKEKPAPKSDGSRFVWQPGDVTVTKAKKKA